MLLFGDTYDLTTDILLTERRYVVSRLYRCVVKKSSEVKYKGLSDYCRSGLKYPVRTGLTLSTLCPINVFILLNGWICLYSVLD